MRSRAPSPPDTPALAQPSLATVGTVADYVSGHAWTSEGFLRWPPDVFGVVGAVLHRSGAYTAILADSRPQAALGGNNAWTTRLQAIARRWRHAAVTRRGRVPIELRRWWGTVTRGRSIPLRSTRAHPRVRDALFSLFAAADEACYGVGVPPVRGSFEIACQNLLLDSRDGGSTLGKRLAKDILRILPKLHTPLAGLTIRSLSHHLSLCPSGDLEARWYMLPLRHVKTGLNLLLLPWPTGVRPSQFIAARTVRRGPRGRHTAYGLFDYRPGSLGEGLDIRVRRLLDTAARDVGPIHGVILPELAAAKAEFNVIAREAGKVGAFVLGGVSEPNENYLEFTFGFSKIAQLRVRQYKHHRWRLEKAQIRQYGLGYSLDPGMSWWENIRPQERKLSFFSLLNWLTISVLICKDLARQEPAAELLRSVGPNLVIALLMDGPQLRVRWPARYATVLAEDPGSSVLTLTNVGMAGLSRAGDGSRGSRCVGLWRDAKSSSIEQIECPVDADGVVLCLTQESVEEWTADGRGDRGTTRYPTLGGYHAIRVDP